MVCHNSNIVDGSARRYIVERSLSGSTCHPHKDYILSLKNIVTLVNLTLNVAQSLILRLICMDTNTLGFSPGNVTERIVAINFAHIESQKKDVQI